MPAAAYPKEIECDLKLRDGTHVRIRPIRPDDEIRLVRLYDRLSRDTAYQRFFTVMHRLPPDWARYLAAVDYVRRLALVVVSAADPEAEVIAVARYEPTDEPETAEVAFVVEDRWQGRGLGRVLFERLLASAGQRGVKQFRAYVLDDNSRMLNLIARFGDIRHRALQHGVVDLLFIARAEPRAVSCDEPRRSPSA